MAKSNEGEGWSERFFDALIDTGADTISKSDLEHKLWLFMNRTSDRQKFGFNLSRIIYYFKVQGFQHMVKWNLVADDFPTLKARIKTLMKEIDKRNGVGKSG